MVELCHSDAANVDSGPSIITSPTKIPLYYFSLVGVWTILYDVIWTCGIIRKLGHGFDDDDVATHVSDFLNEPSPIKKKLLWSYN